MRYTKQTTIGALAAALAAGGLVALYARRDRSPRFLRSMREVVDDVELPDHMGAAIAGVAAVAVGSYLLSTQLLRRPGVSHTMEESIEVGVPVRTAYNQWTQFESFPQFMASVQSVEQIDDTHLRWRAVVGGKVKQWESEITEQIPDERIAWRSVSGAPNAGVVTFHKIDDNRTRIMLRMDYTPETALEKTGDSLGATQLTAKANLEKFKVLLESRGHETGAWRGTVAQPH